MPPLATALQTCDMLLIDGLHAFEFTCDETGLRIECMDGRQLRRWTFTPGQIASARAEGNDWLLADAQAEYRLVLMSALRAPEDDEDEPDLEVPAER